MPLHFEMNPIHGISASLALDGEVCQIEIENFYTTEDGGKLIDLLEEMSRTFLHRSKFRPAQIEQFLLILDRKNQATLYCNELIFTPLVRINRTINAGDRVMDADLVDVEAMELYTADKKKVVLPEQAAIVFMFSIGWRKGLYFNFGPLHLDKNETLAEMPSVFGRLYGHLYFLEKTKLKEQQWDRLFSWGWFPFCSLTREELSECAAWTARDLYPEVMLRKICKRIQARIPQLIETWKLRPEFASHVPFMETAFAALLRGDYISTVQVLMPRIQGIMHEILNSNAKQQVLANSIVKNHDTGSFLLPEKFQQYLVKCYFRSFDLEAGARPLARHTIAHGVSHASDYNDIAATLPFLIFDQIFYFLPIKRGALPPSPFSAKDGGTGPK